MYAMRAKVRARTDEKLEPAVLEQTRGDLIIDEVDMQKTMV